MILKVEHSLFYTYADTVSLNPHYFYLSPVPNPYQQVSGFCLDVTPGADKLTRNIDQEGNIQHVCFVNTPTDKFEVKTSFVLHSEEFNSLDFIIFPFAASKIPLVYPSKHATYFELLLKVNPVCSEVQRLGDSLAAESGHDTIGFLLVVITYISSNFRYISRERGDALAPEETLRTQSGSCRDFSVLMLGLCASQGLMARFVSGYLFGSERHQHDLHAWVEVFLPGGGWRGFDPTEGQVVDKNYIALAASLESGGISPVRGSYRANGNVESGLETHVDIKEIG